MATISDLVVKITAKTAEFKRDVKRAQTTMGRFAEDSRKNMDKLRGAITPVGAAIRTVAKIAAAGVGAATAFFAALTIKAGTIKELNTLSQSVGVSVENLQRWQFAAQKVGIESDKMGDIFKDTADKLGDFLTTGGGEAADLFEQLNLKASEFVGLSPDQALLKIGSALEGLTQGEKIFFMEAIADDASRLIPLLENNAEKLREFGKEAERTGNVLDDTGVQAAIRFRQQWDLLIAKARGFVTQLTGQLAPVMETILAKINEWVDKFGGMPNLARAFAKSVISGIKSIISGFSGFIRGLGNIEAGWKKIQRAVIATGEKISEVINFFTPSVWAQKFGVNFSDTAIQAFEKNLQGTREMLTRQINELESSGRNGIGKNITNFLDGLISDIDNAGAEQVENASRVRNEVDQLGSKLGDNKDSTDDNKKSTDDNTKATNKLTETIAASTARQATQRKKETEDFGAASTFERSVSEFRRKLESGLITEDKVKQSGITHLLEMRNRYARAGGFDTDQMDMAIQSLRQFADSEREKNTATQKQSWTLNINGEKTTGDVEGDSVLLDRIATVFTKLSNTV